jgi:hypothetical protein
MRLLIAVIFLIGAPMMLPEMAIPAAACESAEKAAAFYDPNPAHIWNRLYAALLVREDSHVGQYDADSLDPPLWLESEYLLAGPSHARALRVLDEFLQTHAENLIRDPLKRAMLQRDLWAVFDWSVQQESARQRPHYDNERRELQTRLAEALRRLALSPKEIESLPDNYAQAVASGAFAKDYDPAHRERAFLPPDLFDGSWLYIDSSPEEFNSGGVAPSHVEAFSGRSRFLVFMRLPEGRKATLAYLQALWNFPQPWVQGRPDSAADQAVINPDLPSFPAGTELALVRQMTLFDGQGNLVPTPITESVQIRVYYAITPTLQACCPGDMSDIARISGQDFYQFTLSRAQLFASKADGLRSTGRDEKQLSTFQQQGGDLIDEFSENPALKKTWLPALQTCLACHIKGGVRSLNSLGKLLKPNWRQRDFGDEPYPPRWWLNAGTTDWKRDRYDWGLLNGYWRSDNRFY